MSRSAVSSCFRAMMVAVSVAAATDCRAALLFEQPPDPRIRAGSSSTLDFFGRFPGRRSADDFTIPATATIGQVHWWGQHAPPSSGEDNFSITFYNDIGGLPGDVLLVTGAAVNAFPTPQISDLTSYEARLDTDFQALGGVTYWLSIFNSGPSTAWRWNNSLVGNEISVQSFVPPDNEFNRVNGTEVDLSYRLIAVPEPTTAGVLMLGLAGLCARRGRG